MNHIPNRNRLQEIAYGGVRQSQDEGVFMARALLEAMPAGYVLVPVKPTEHMVVEGFECWPDKFFSEHDVWAAYQAMSGCRQAAHRAELCWAAMIAAAPKVK